MISVVDSKKNNEFVSNIRKQLNPEEPQIQVEIEEKQGPGAFGVMIFIIITLKLGAFLI